MAVRNEDRPRTVSGDQTSGPGRRPSASRSGLRRWRLPIVLAGVLVALIATAWALPRVSDAAEQWLADEPVRAQTVDVEALETDMVPPGVELPDGAALDDADGQGPDLWRDTGVVDAGLQFNLLGAEGRPDAAGDADVGEATEAAASAEAQDDADEAATDGLAEVPDEVPAAVVVRTSLDGETWSEWMTLELTPAEDEIGTSRLIGDPLWVGEARYVEFRSVGAVGDLELSFINSLGDATVADRIEGALKSAVATIASLGAAPPAAASPARPAIVTRAQWAANESWRRAGPSYASTVKMAFIHHTAGGNTYTAEEAPAVVRAIYYYHARTLGFNDIGYNFLIDRYGTIYEGRYGGMTKAVIGAQTLGFNTGSTGISIMGEFGTEAPPPKAFLALEDLLAWKLTYHGVDPTSAVSMYCGTSDKFAAGQWVTFPAISAHRDACYTSCPGQAFYGKIPAVRRAVEALVDGAGVFRTEALRNFGIRRGTKARFRYRVVYKPAAGAETYTSARVVLKVRDSKGRSRLTKVWSSRALNRSYYFTKRLFLAKGNYRYYVYATLPDGTKQTIVGSARLRIR